MPPEEREGMPKSEIRSPAYKAGLAGRPKGQYSILSLLAFNLQGLQQNILAYGRRQVNASREVRKGSGSARCALPV